MARDQRPLTGPFWAAVDRGELVRPVCDDCGTNFFTPQVVCPGCQSTAWRYRPSSGRGVVYSHTTIHRPPDPRFEPPYVLADVQVSEGDGSDGAGVGWRLLTWIVGCDPDEVSIGQPVRVRFTPGVDGELLPTFELDPERVT